MAGVRERRLNEILLALGCTVWQSDIPSTSNRVIRRLIGPPSFSFSLSLFRSSLSLRYNDPLSTRVHQAFNVLHQFFSSFLFLPPFARSLRRFADYSTTRRREREKVKLAGCKRGEKRGDAARNKRICRRPFLFLLFTLLTLLVE